MSRQCMIYGATFSNTFWHFQVYALKTGATAASLRNHHSCRRVTVLIMPRVPTEFHWLQFRPRSLFTTFTLAVSRDSWAPPGFALLEWIRRGCSELFHAFSLDCLNGSITHTTGQLFIQGHGLGNLSIVGSCLRTTPCRCCQTWHENVQVRSAGADDPVDWETVIHKVRAECTWSWSSFER